MIRRARAEERPVDSGLTPEQALENLQSGLDYFFGETSAADLAAQMDVERARIHEIRDSIAARLEAEFALLDALSPDPDLEDGGDAEPSLCGLNVSWPSPDDREAGDDNGIGDAAGAWEQGAAGFGEPFAYGFSGWHRLSFRGAR